MYLRLILMTLLGVTAAVAGCTGGQTDKRLSGMGPQFEAEPTAATVAAGTRRLELLTDRRIGLAFGEEALLRVALTRSHDGEPIEGAHVSFAFEGVAQDASLASLDVATDGSGIAENMLHVGEFIGTFTVIISAPGADAVTVQVSVGNAGFGTVVVRAPYAGERQVQQRRIAIVPQASCDDAEPSAGDHMEWLAEPGDEAVFLLPARKDYAVVAFAHGLDDTVLAWGCAVAHDLAPDVETTIEITFDDNWLVSTGNYELAAELDSTEPAATLALELEAAAIAFVETDADGMQAPQAAGARLLLDTLQELLRSDAYVMAGLDVVADDLQAARAVPDAIPSVDEELQLALDGAAPAVGPRVAAGQLAADVLEGLSMVTLTATLAIDGENAGAPLSWTPLSVQAGALDDGRQAAALDLSAQGGAEVNATLLPNDDSVDLQQARFGLPWGAVAAEVLTALRSPPAQADTDALRDGFGCDAFAAWVAEAAATADRCDEACAQEACGIALQRMADATDGALRSLDEARPTVTMWGRLSLYDDTGDLAVERMDIDQLHGQWEDPPAGEPERFDGSGWGEVLLNLIDR